MEDGWRGFGAAERRRKYKYALRHWIESLSANGSATSSCFLPGSCSTVLLPRITQTSAPVRCVGYVNGLGKQCHRSHRRLAEFVHTKSPRKYQCALYYNLARRTMAIVLLEGLIILPRVVSLSQRKVVSSSQCVKIRKELRVIYASLQLC